MNKKTVRAVAIIIAFAMVITSLSFIMFLPSAFGAENSLTLQEQRQLTKKMAELEEYIKWIHNNYKDEVEYEILLNGAFEGAMYALGDPYSIFYVDDSEGQAFWENATGIYGGIGVSLEVSNEGCIVSEFTSDAPAEKAGIKIGDQILRIDGVDVTKMNPQEVSALLRGHEGTTVNVVIKREGQERSFSIVREEINTVSVAGKMLDGQIGYIQLASFTIDGASQFKKEKSKLIEQGAKSLIIDIRNNGGGVINTAVSIAEEILPADKIVFHLQQQGEILESIKTLDAAEIKLPMVLLVNEYSASATELLAGALQDNKVATLVGTTTYGKGVAQISRDTEEGHIYKLSSFYFLTPNQHSIHLEGITPDVVVTNSLGEFRQDALIAYLNAAPFAETAKPKPGDTGLNVYAAQQRLQILGYKIETTGTMDEETVRGIKTFQKEQGLYAYGTLDLTTMVALESVVIAYIDNQSSEDLQLNKAIEILSK